MEQEHRTGELRLVRLDQLIESPHNTRRTFHGINEIADSIREKGILTPLLVRPMNGKMEVLCGARRLRASKQLEITEVPAIVRKLSDKEAMEIIVIDNLQREDVHELDEARGYEQLLKKHGYTAETLAPKVGKSLSYVYQRLKLLSLIGLAKSSFLSGRFTAGHAILLARLQPDMQERAMKACRITVELEGKDTRFDSKDVVDDPIVSVRGLKQWIENNVHVHLARATFALDDTELDKEAGACTSCPKRSGSNPELFADISITNICTDPACFRRKEDMYLRKTQEEAERKLLPLSSVQDIPDEDRKNLPDDLKKNWKTAKEGSCPNTRKGVIVYGPGVGRVATVCAATRSCKKHHPSTFLRGERSVGSGPPVPKTVSPAELRKERKASEVALIDRIATTRIIGAILERARVALPRLVLEELVRRADITGDEKTPEWMELEKKFPHLFGDFWLRDSMRGLSDEDLIRVLHLQVLMEGHENIAPLAKHYKVNENAIEKQVRKEVQSAPKCERCGCTEYMAFEGGCSWSPEYQSQKRYVCTACVDAFLKEEAAKVQTSAKAKGRPVKKSAPKKRR